MNKPYRPIQQHLVTAMVGLLLLINSASFAQLNPKYLTQYTELDGVPGVQVNSIVTDRLGYIWIGTINGLARYDGYEFKRYFNNPNDSASMQGLIVWSMFEDHKGQIWVGAGPGFLNVYNPITKSFRRYDYTKLVKHAANGEVGINAISEDNKGRIYLGVTTYYGETIQNGLLYIDEKEDKVKKVIAADNQPFQNVYNITKDNRGNTWVLSYTGIIKIDTNRKLSKIPWLDSAFYKNQEGPSAIQCDKAGHIWFISSKCRLYDFNPADSSVKTYSPEGLFTDNFINNKIVFDKNDNIWMGTNKGLMRFIRKTGQFETFKKEALNKQEDPAIVSLSFDSFGTLWAGTTASGLLKYEERALFKSYSFNKEDKSSLTSGWANNIYETQDGKIWITTGGRNDGGINVLDPQTNILHPFPYTAILPGCYGVNGLYENTPGELWMNTSLGTYQFSTATNRVKKIMLKGVPDNIFIYYFYKDSRENLWLCTFSGLYKKEKNTELFKKYDLSTVSGGNAGSNEITRAFESSKHGLWLATNNGLFLYNYATDKIERHGFDKKAGDIFITQDINSFYEAADGTAWVGTWQGGLSRYTVETKKIKSYTRDNGLASMSVQGILADEKNNTLWLSTFEGLSRFDITTGQCNNYSLADGIQGQLFADGAALKTSKGLFAFGGSNGISIFNPGDINRNSTPPKVFLTDLKLFNKSVMPGEKSVLKNPIDETKEIELAYDQNNISLEFLAIHFSNPAKNKYAYQLENYDNEWREVANQHVAFYPKLSPGEYLFKVKAANNNGIWNETGATLKITIRPPWWRTPLAYAAYLLLLIAGGFAADRYLRYRLIEKERERNKAKELEQAKEIEKAYYKLEQTHEALKATQSQLVQSEKMASLGELTAGIAHEIQNPLNFINNFSDVNTELIEELKTEMQAGNNETAIAIADDITSNEQKINHHGKRADAIVKGMLQHSRRRSGTKEPTDINALADEYLRLAYHGLRAKDKSFNATMKTDFDAGIGNIHIIPQDIGRVILNLINNAFYAVAEKTKQQTEGYEPTVSISTKKIDGKVEIIVKDNGNGIPQKVVDKIFQPFFTTKPTGQGTGLGLSLSYDIVKAHGGEIKVESREGEGTEFIIMIPA